MFICIDSGNGVSGIGKTVQEAFEDAESDSSLKDLEFYEATKIRVEVLVVPLLAVLTKEKTSCK